MFQKKHLHRPQQMRLLTGLKSVGSPLRPHRGRVVTIIIVSIILPSVREVPNACLCSHRVLYNNNYNNNMQGICMQLNVTTIKKVRTISSVFIIFNRLYNGCTLVEIIMNQTERNQQLKRPQKFDISPLHQYTFERYFTGFDFFDVYLNRF